MTREERPVAGHYAFGPFRIDVAGRQLYRDGEPVALAGKAFDTLLILVARHGQVVEKDELLALIWPDTHVSEDSLTQSISVVRRTLGDDSTQPQMIATVPRRGYRFIAPVDGTAVSPETGPGPSPHAHPPAVSARAWPWRTSTWSGTGPLLWLGLPPAVVLIVFARSIDVPSAVPTARPVRFTHEAPAGTTLTSGGVLSPDGRYLAFVARQADDGKPRLWVRAMDSAQSRALPGTEGAFRPFW